MKNRAAFLAALLVQCTGTAPPAPGPAASLAPPAAAAGGEAGPGPAVGQKLPPFEAPDADGTRRRFETLRGKNGLLLNFNRSVVW